MKVKVNTMMSRGEYEMTYVTSIMIKDNVEYITIVWINKSGKESVQTIGKNFIPKIEILK